MKTNLHLVFLVCKYCERENIVVLVHSPVWLYQLMTRYNYVIISADIVAVITPAVQIERHSVYNTRKRQM